MNVFRRLLQLALAAALGALAPCAQALEAKDLAGWWIALDPAIPRLVEAGLVVSMDEVLVIHSDGAVENRAMMFIPADPVDCGVTMATCSDAPLIARARLTAGADTIAFVDVVPGPGPIDAEKVDPFIRVSALTAVPAWSVQAEAGGQRLILRAAAPATISAPAGTDIRQLTGIAATATRRTLVRIDPDRLRLLRAAMMGSGRSAARHWRCYLANATVGEPAFAGVLQPRLAAVPAEFPGYLRVAGYMAALSAHISHPTPDHPDPDTRKAVGANVEQLMLPRFDDLAPPATTADIRRSAARLAYVAARGQGAGAEAAQAEAAKILPEPVAVRLSDADLAAYAKLRPDGPASKALFCIE